MSNEKKLSDLVTWGEVSPRAGRRQLCAVFFVIVLTNLILLLMNKASVEAEKQRAIEQGHIFEPELDVFATLAITALPLLLMILTYIGTNIG